MLRNRLIRKLFIKNAGELRVKESDRIKSTTLELRKMGVNIEEREDGMVIEGSRQITGTEVNNLDPYSLNWTAGTNTLDVNNAANNLTLNQVVNAGSLAKAGAGILTLANNNSYLGGTLISSGVLQVGNNGTNGALGAGLITNNGALVFQQPDNRSVTGQISGTGTLAQQGLLVLDQPDQQDQLDQQDLQE